MLLSNPGAGMSIKHARTFFVFVVLLPTSALPLRSVAQSTDGFHTLQLFPVVVDSGSFTQAFQFRGDQRGASTIEPTYYPSGDAVVAPVACPPFELPWAGRRFDSLRALCPGVAAGSQFGMLALRQVGEFNRPFSAFSRVSNPAGAGFAVESFPAHTFTSAFSTVAGLRRSAATTSSPAFQSNCFFGLLPETNGTATGHSRLIMALMDENGGALGAQVVLRDLWPGQLVRAIDIFGAMGAPPGDHLGATMIVRNISSWNSSDESKPGIVSFCTVQDNTSFGADFRIAKQEVGLDGFAVTGIAAQDSHVDRETLSFADMPATGGVTGRAHAIVAASGQQNSHVMYFRHPDWVSCELIDPATHARPGANFGLELRLLALDQAGANVLAGGDNATGWSRIYLGDKREHGGENTRYLIQVEDNGSPGPVGSVAYGLHCESGSGHTSGDVISFQRAANEF
jgi:hypothetical protein